MPTKKLLETIPNINKKHILCWEVSYLSDKTNNSITLLALLVMCRITMKEEILSEEEVYPRQAINLIIETV